MNTIHKLIKRFCVLLGMIVVGFTISSSVNLKADTIQLDTIAQTAVDDYEIPGADDSLGLSGSVWLQKYEYVTTQHKALFTWTTESPNLVLSEILETNPNYSSLNQRKFLILETLPDENEAITAQLTLTATFEYGDEDNPTVTTATRVFELTIAQVVNLMDYSDYENVTTDNLVKVRGTIYAMGDITTDLSHQAVILKDENSENFYYLNNLEVDESYGIGNLVEVLGVKTKTGEIGDYGLTLHAEENKQIKIDNAANQTEIPYNKDVTFEEDVVVVKKISQVDETPVVKDVEYQTKNVSDIESSPLYEVANYNNLTFTVETNDDVDTYYFVSGTDKVELATNSYVNENLSVITSLMNTDAEFNMVLIIVFEDGVKKVEPFDTTSVQYVDSVLQTCYESILDVVPEFANVTYDTTISSIELPTSTKTTLSWSSSNKYVNFRTDGTGETTAIVKVPSEGETSTIVTLTSTLDGKSVSRDYIVYQTAGEKVKTKFADYFFAGAIVVAIIIVIIATIVSKKLGEEKAEIRRNELRDREEKARASRGAEANAQLENLSGIENK